METTLDRPQRQQPLWNQEFLAASASVAPSSLDSENRTVDVIWFTGVDIPRVDWWTGEPYILRFDPNGADLSLLNSGAPVLDNHMSRDGSASQKGKVERAWKDDSYKATLRFSKRPEVDGLWQDIEDRIVTKFSMGVEILEQEKLTEDSDNGKKITVKLAKKWRPFELSISPVPADFGTTTLAAHRGGDIPRASAQTGDNPMENQTTAGVEARETTQEMDRGSGPDPVPAQPNPSAQQNPPAQQNPEELKKEGAAAERARIAELRRIGRAANLDEKLIEEHVQKETTAEEFRKIALEELSRRSDEHPIRTATASITRDQADTRREAMTNALLNRFSPAAFKLEEAAREYVGLSLIEMAKECLEAVGIRTRMLPKMRIAELALQSTSDFPNILAATAYKTLRGGYEAEPLTFAPFSRRVTLPNFNTFNALAIGEGFDFERVPEAGEFKYGAIKEGKETYRLATYGKIVAITRQAIINDDLNAFTRIPEMHGRAARRLELDTVWGIITANAAMGDGVALFHANHGNLASSGAAPAVTTLGAGRKAMRVQKAVGGKARLNLRPRYLLLPASLETVSDQLLTQITPAVVSNAVPEWVRGLVPIVEPRLDDNSTSAWYLAADPGQIDTIWYCYLQGQEGVFLETEQGFEVDGIKLKARLDFGAAVIDYRGLYKDPGA